MKDIADQHQKNLDAIYERHKQESARIWAKYQQSNDQIWDDHKKRTDAMWTRARNEYIVASIILFSLCALVIFVVVGK